MRELLIDLTNLFKGICPTFVQVPPKTPYPYITLEPDLMLQGLPWGPRIATFTVKIWSRYAGTFEILTMAKTLEELIQNYTKTTLQIRESTLEMLKDGQTRVHRLKIKARLKGV